MFHFTSYVKPSSQALPARLEQQAYFIMQSFPAHIMEDTLSILTPTGEKLPLIPPRLSFVYAPCCFGWLIFLPLPRPHPSLAR